MRRRLAALFSPPLIGCVIGLVVSSGLIACEPSDPTPRGRGRGIFQRTCSGCHGADGKGTMRPGLSRPPRDLTNPEFQSRMTDDQLRQSIRVGKGQMPAFGGLMGDEEITNVIAFIRSLAPPGTVIPGHEPSGAAGASGTATLPAAAPGAAASGAAGASSSSEPAAVTARGSSTP